MNKVILKGNIVSEINILGNGDKKAIRFPIAVRRGYGEEIDFLNCVAFNKTAEFINKYFEKGTPILVVGRIENSKYQNKEGEMKYSTSIIIDSVEFAGGKKKEETFDELPF